MRQLGHDAIAMLVALIAGEQLDRDPRDPRDDAGAPAYDRCPWRCDDDRAVAGPDGAGRGPGRRPGRPDDASRRRSPSSARSLVARPGGRRDGADAARDGGSDAAVGGGHRRRARPADPDLRHRTARAGRRDADPGPAAARRDGRQPVRHPGPGARGGADRAGRVGGHHLSRAAVLGRVLRPRPGRADGGADRGVHAQPRHPPGPGAGARRGPRPPLGSRRGDPGRGPVPGRSGRQRLRARAGAGRRRGDAQALPRLLRLARRRATSRRCRSVRASWPT